MISKLTSLVTLPLLLAVPASAAPVTYSDVQAAKGMKAYEENCSSCHGNSLEGSHLAPSLFGSRFDQQWRGKSAAVLSLHIRRMPPAGNGGQVRLSHEAYTDILAYLLKSNDLEAGQNALPSAMAALRQMTIPRLERVEPEPDAPVTLSTRQRALLDKLPPVTDELLKNPPPGEWLRWGRSADGMNFSPLTKINQANVTGLELAWRASMRPGLSMSMPLVHEGVLFLHGFPDTMLAMDATNGEVLWRHQHKPVTESTHKMGIALQGDRVLVPTSDLHVLALSAKTGKVIWDHEIATEVPIGGRTGLHLRGAPMAAGNKVIQGVSSSLAPRGGFIVGLDAETGKEVWRFHTIPRPGEPGGDTWNGLPLDKRSGGSVWHQGTYDPELNLVYYGVAPTYDTGPLLHAVEQDGITNEALYTNCTVALNADTGELVWYYQHMPNDQWDLDWAFERQIVTVPIDGKDRKVVMNVGKMAILEALDAATGEYLFSVDTGTQNVITAIDKKTGKKTFDPDKMPDVSRPTVVCPTTGGARNWPPTSLSPETNFLYIPINEWCSLQGPEGPRLLTSGVGISSAKHPDAQDGKMGRLQAIDVAGQKLAWKHDQVAPISTGMLATGGGLLFSGDLEPSLKAFDARTGELLWQTKLDDLPSSSVISYSVNDVQYVAVLVGITNLHLGSLDLVWKKFRADLAASGSEDTFGEAPNGGAALWVFTL